MGIVTASAGLAIALASAPARRTPGAPPPAGVTGNMAPRRTGIAR